VSLREGTRVHHLIQLLGKAALASLPSGGTALVADDLDDYLQQHVLSRRAAVSRLFPSAIVPFFFAATSLPLLLLFRPFHSTISNDLSTSARGLDAVERCTRGRRSLIEQNARGTRELGTNAKHLIARSQVAASRKVHLLTSPLIDATDNLGKLEWQDPERKPIEEPSTLLRLSDYEFDDLTHEGNPYRTSPTTTSSHLLSLIPTSASHPSSRRTAKKSCTI